MFSVLASLVGEPAGHVEGAKPQLAAMLANERQCTVSTVGDDETTSLLTDQVPFLVEVVPETDGIPLGIIVSSSDDSNLLRIDDVRSPGLISKWNAAHSEDLAVHPGHIITSVNGTSSSSREMLNAIRSVEKDVPVRLFIQVAQDEAQSSISVASDASIVSIDDGRPAPPGGDPFFVKLTPGSEDLPLGLAISLDDDPSFLTVDAISSPGLISQWNILQQEEQKVRVGDIITAINRCSDNGRQMLELINSIRHMNRGAKLQLTIDPRRRIKRERKRTHRPRPRLKGLWDEFEV